jgi:hypothetical protein
MSRERILWQVISGSVVQRTWTLTLALWEKQQGILRMCSLIGYALLLLLLHDDPMQAGYLNVDKTDS